ncbi:3-oxoacyl-ACP reductase family protein [Rahnella perminowiae]|jgi:3-oxoacyl-[acyl-carrier protein] reductase|uniref:3-oxoacyl-ACP reductase family protein n=1 Tax=Rahnella TaxID=34037 RepID=UPI001021CFA5|nr:MULTISPECIES: 3-oxoacyl-ACP reductase family protein [Rahnella]MBU9813242.1 3-oxoacyl-ACP reductase FabG [Rahnella perminowiae]MCR8999616.1 3-oxoacyl-ACP reductase FabG [Rahnella perminowiae]
MTTQYALQSKAAFVQGGSRGIGAAIVQRLASEGASVAFTYVSSEDKAQALVKTIEASGGKALAIKADSADESSVRSAIDSAAKAFGKIDILVNNAGVLAFGEIDALTMDDFDRTIAINVRSVFVASQQAARHMPDGGRIITIGSVNADRMPFQGGAVYAMSKSAIVGLTKGLARDLGPRGITVNNVQPGPVDTDMNPADGEMADGMRSYMALNRYGKDSEIASFVAYLSGPEAGYITGANLTIDGGFGA